MLDVTGKQAGWVSQNSAHNQPRILISGCLLGKNVRYDGGHCFVDHPRLNEWVKSGFVMPVCPEMAGGLSSPRRPAEISGPDAGNGVLMGSALVLDRAGNNVTSAFIKGAESVLSVARHYQIKVAILKENSPSCGSKSIYDGTFSGKKMPGTGVTSALLQMEGLAVFSEFFIDEALDLAERISC